MLRGGKVFALELKTERGRPTAAQTKFISEFRAAGGAAAIANGLDQALHTLEIWGSYGTRSMNEQYCVVDNTKGLKT